MDRDTTSPRPSPQDHTELRMELSIATSRLLLSSSGLIAVLLTPTPVGFAKSVYVVLGGYALFAAGCSVALRYSRRVTWLFGAATHLVDLGTAAMITLLTDGSNSPFFVFLNYPILTAAYRWGLQETLSTVVTAIVLLAIESAVLTGNQPAATAMDAFVAPRPFLRAVYLVIVGLLVGYLSDAEKRRRAEAMALARMLSEVRVGRPLEDALQEVLRALLRLFRARGAWLIMQDVRSGRAFSCRTGFTGAREGPSVAIRELSSQDGDRLLQPLPGPALYGVRRRVWGGWRYLAVDAHGVATNTSATGLPTGVLPDRPCRRVIAATQAFDTRWVARVFVVDPAFVLDREESARTLQRVMGQVGPALFEHYQLRRVREQASLAERTRIVRELHDGPVQSLLGMEMELAVLRRSARDRAPQLEPELARFHDTLKREVVGLREVFEGVRAGTSPSRPIQQDLTDMVTRFAIYTGLDARFIGEHPPVLLPSTERREVLRIVHEALANIRKHSGARRVVVQSQIQNHRLLLHIDDNGKGFPWAGTRTDAELRAAGHGPWTMLDRLVMIDGTLSITSRPGAGSRVELTCPLPILTRALA